MNVNQKGVTGLIKVIDDLQSRGFYTFPAFDDHSPVDLIAMDGDGNTYRLQIKYREKKKDVKRTSYSLSANSVVNGKKVAIDRNLIDGWAVYMKDDNKIVYIHKEIMGNKGDTSLYPEVNYGELVEWFKTSSC